MKKPKVLITGSEGRVGKVLIKGLSRDFEIYRLDAVKTKAPNYFRSDIARIENLKKVFSRIGKIDYIVHLAADPRVDASWESILKNNIIGLRNIYECAREFKVKKVIFASSNHASGMYEGLPPRLHKLKTPPVISVSNPVRPDGYYGTSKVFGEAIARQFYELYGLESICLRIGSVVENDDPTKDPTKRHLKTWLSYRDLTQLVKKAIASKIKFGIFYAISDNKGRFWDIETTKKELGYKPQDDASKYKKR